MIFKSIAAMNRTMAIQARATKEPVARASAGKTRFGIIGCSGMSLPVMAILTEVGHLFSQ